MNYFISNMSVKKALSLNHSDAAKGGGGAKRGRFGRFLSCKEISVEPGKTLKEMDSNRLKAEIKRWAKAVVSYARQVSSRFGRANSSV